MRTTTAGRARPSHSREDLLDAAAAEFAAIGFADASMDAIAARACATRPTLYSRLGNKHDIYLLCLQSEYERLTTWLVSSYEAGARIGGKEGIRHDVHAFFDYAAAHPQGFRLLFEGRDELAAQYRDKVIGFVSSH